MGNAFLHNHSTVRKLPVLNSAYPADVRVVADNGSASFSVMIAEDGKPDAYTYQWYVDSSPVSGATAPTYSMSGLDTIAAHTVYCTVTNKAGTVVSRVASLNVYATVPVLNNSYPANVSVVADNGSATFEVKIATAGKPASYTYQWYVDDVKISGATGAKYTIKNLNTVETKTVYCVVSHKAGTVTSRKATLNVYATKPVLDGSYPKNANFSENSDGSATFKVVITTAGEPDSYTYQWYLDGSAVSGATASSYKVSGLSAGSYSIYCKVKNKGGTVNSRTATLTVKPYYPILVDGTVIAAAGSWKNVSATSFSDGKITATSDQNNGNYGCFSKKINAKNYTTLKFIVTQSYCYPGIPMKIGLSTEQPAAGPIGNQNVGWVATKSVSDVVTNKTYSIDISSLTSSYYFTVVCISSFTISKIWLE